MRILQLINTGMLEYMYMPEEFIIHEQPYEEENCLTILNRERTEDFRITKTSLS